MTLYQLAKNIPHEFRVIILQGNYIWKAIADPNDPDMVKLFIFYHNYIEPDNPQYNYSTVTGIPVIGGCLVCLGNVIDKFKLLEPHLIQLVKENELMEL